MEIKISRELFRIRFADLSNSVSWDWKQPKAVIIQKSGVPTVDLYWDLACSNELKKAKLAGEHREYDQY